MKKSNYPQYNLIDNVVRFFSPMAGVRRAQARMALNIIDNARERSFQGSSKSHRFSGWKRPSSSADTALAGSRSLLRNGSRDLTRNNPWAEHALCVIENNTVGTGILPQVHHESKARAKEIQALLDKWIFSTSIDAEDRLDLVALESLIIRTTAESGEILVRRRFRRARDKYPIPIQIQLLEPDFLDESKDTELSNGGQIKGGIEYDKRGKATFYHLFKQHPGEARAIRGSYESVRVPARDIIHVFDPKRAGQSRGYPWVASAIKRLKDFDDYEDAQLVRQKIAACFSAFVFDASAGDNDATGVSTGKAPEEDDLEHLQPGVIEHLPPGKDIKFPTPPAVQNYSEYQTSILRGAAAGFGITYEAMTQDYSKVNFSSGRMGWIEMNRNINRWQNTIMRAQVLERLSRWFFAGAGLVGVNTEGATIKWTMPRREMIDPTKEIPAMVKAIRAGLTTLKKTHLSLGYNHDDILAEIEETNKRLDDAGIVLDSDARRVSVEGSDNSKTSEFVDGEDENKDTD